MQIEIVDALAKYFHSKITTTRDQPDDSSHREISNLLDDECLTHIKPLSESASLAIRRKATSAFRDLKSFLTKLVYNHINIHHPNFTTIVNCSLDPCVMLKNLQTRSLLVFLFKDSWKCSSFDSGNVSFPVMFNLSSALNTIDHDHFFLRCDDQFGVHNSLIG